MRVIVQQLATAVHGQPNSDTYLKMKYESDHRISIYLTSDNSLGDRTIVRELIVRDSMYDMATQDDEITGLKDSPLLCNRFYLLV